MSISINPLTVCLQRTLVILVSLVSLSFISFGQSTPTKQSNNSLNFNTYLSGIKYAKLLRFYKSPVTIPQKMQSICEAAFMDWLREIGFEYAYDVDYDDQDFFPNSNSLCLQTTVAVMGTYSNDGIITSMGFTFESCNGDSWSFEKQQCYVDMSRYENNFENNKKVFRNIFNGMYSYMKPAFSSYNTYSLKNGGPKSYYREESNIKTYLSHTKDPIEGIYEKSFADANSPSYKIAVIKTNGSYQLVYLSGATHQNDWQVGDVKAIINPTASNSLYKGTWYMADKSSKDAFVGFEANTMKVILNDRNPDLYIKMFPTAADKPNSTDMTASGTGFAVNTLGYIVTNYHVIDGASSIKVKGINGDFTRSYIASIIVSDKANDLSLLKISDADFKGLGVLPYSITFKNAAVGNDVYALGYPLRATMGDEVKLTNGIISANSGFEGSLNQYQISVPLQPGNSGGPLINSQGNIVGVVNAKHTGAENVSYAIKGSFLANLIESSDTKITLPLANTLIGKSLSQQVQIVKKFIYIIEVN